MSHTVKGRPPEAGQRTKYQAIEDGGYGEIYNNAKINSVGESSPDGGYTNVNVTWTPPGEMPQTGDHVYAKYLGIVRGDPSGPPWPPA